MIVDRFRALDRETQFVVGLAVAFVLYRTVVAGLSGFGFHQGWNEGHYALIGRGFLDHPLVPHYADRYVYSVPPLFPYAVAGSMLAIGESVLAARVPSVLATGGLIVGTYWLGRAVFDRARTALIGALLVAVLPYVQLYGGRAQTDALLVSLLTLALAAIVRGYRRDRWRRWHLLGGALFAAAVAAKQPAILLAGVVLAWLLADRRWDRDTVTRTGVLVTASVAALLPLVAWLALNYAQYPTAFVSDWQHELFSRTAPFANVPLVVVIGLGLGATPPVLAAAAIGVLDDLADVVRRTGSGLALDRGPSVLVWWLVVFGAFVFYRTPQGHQYYALLLMVPLALLAARGLDVLARRAAAMSGEAGPAVRVALLVLVVGGALGGTVVMFELSGVFSVANGGGTGVAADAGAFVGSDVEDDATVFVENGYTPPLMWYVRGEFPHENIESYHLRQLDRSRLAASADDGPVYVIVPRPSWGSLPLEDATVVHRTDPYRYTVMSAVGAVVDTDSKFTYYLTDRRLVVYRFDAPDDRDGLDSINTDNGTPRPSKVS